MHQIWVSAQSSAQGKGGLFVSLLDPSTGLLRHEAFLQLLRRGTGRGRRYRDVSTPCLSKPELPQGESGLEKRIESALSSKVSEFARDTDLVGQSHEALGVPPLHTGQGEAL